MAIKMTALGEVHAYGSAGDGFTYVAYSHEFAHLTCDHYRRGTIALDMYDANGNMVDSMACCEECLPAGVAIWHVNESDNESVTADDNESDDANPVKTIPPALFSHANTGTLYVNPYRGAEQYQPMDADDFDRNIF